MDDRADRTPDSGEGDQTTHGSAILGATLALLSMLGCASVPQAERPTEGGTESMAAQGLEAARTAVRLSALDVAKAIVARQDPVSYKADGFWTTCADDASTWQYVVDAAFEMSGPSAEQGRQAVQLLEEELGWRLEEPLISGDRLTVRGRRDDLMVTVNAYDTETVMFVSLLGECLPVAEPDRAALQSVNEPLQIPEDTPR